MKKLINNKYAVTAQMESLFSVVVIIAAIGIVIASISTSVEQSNVESITKDAQAVQIAALLTGSTGRSADGSSSWEQSDFKKLDEIEIGLKADLTADQENIVLSSFGITTSPGVISHPPETPILSGPDSGTVGSSIKFFAKSSDSDGDQIRYGWDWDDDDLVDQWTGLYDSGVQIETSHSWAESGSYSIKVKAQDENGLNSSFSSELVVSISGGGNNPPGKAETPVPSVSTTSYGGIIYVILNPGSSCTFSTRATDPDPGDQIRYGWDWNGDKSVDEWSGLMASGSTDSRPHSWAAPGLYKVSVRAKDDSDTLGAFSDTMLVMVDRPPNKPTRPSGDTNVYVNTLESYTTSATDPDGFVNLVQYKFNWGDGTTGSWTTPPVYPGVSGGSLHRFMSEGTFSVTAKARSVYVYAIDIFSTYLPGLESINSDALQVTVQDLEPVYCFVAGTKISMADGSFKNIEDVVVGDSVLSFNFDTGGFEDKKVVETMAPYHSDIVEFVFSNGVLTKHTFDHPYYVFGKGWASYRPDLTKYRYGLDTSQIELGDMVLTDKNERVQLIEINLVDMGVVKTYNFFVEGNHNYFADGILVHNKDDDPEILCCFPAGTKITIADGTCKSIEDVVVGDSVLSFDVEHNDFVVSIVSHLIVKVREGVYDINGGILSPTDDHPLFVHKSDGRIGWAAINAEKSKVMYNDRNAMHLEVGDELFTGDSWIKISSIVYRPGEIITYTFTVDSLHNYFANGLLVSNTETCYDSIPGGGSGGHTNDPQVGCLIGGCCAWNQEDQCIGHYNSECQCEIATLPCFLSGTNVLMGDGNVKNIEDVKVGDLVTSYDLINERLSLDSVVAKFDHEADYMSEGYVIINDDIRGTPNHPVLDQDGNWINIGDLKIGDKLYGGKEIKSLEFIDTQLKSYHMVTNLYHNYLVVFEDGDFIVAKNGYPDGGYEEEEVDINLVLNAKYSDVLSAGKVDTLRYIDYSELKTKLYGDDLDVSSDFSILLRSSTNNDEVYLSYHPDNGRSISDPGTVIASYSENVLLYSKGIGGEDIFTPCEFKVFVY